MTLVINDCSHWRAFEDNQVTHSAAHYLMAIDRLRSDHGYARVTDVASYLNISRGAASIALSQLKERGLVAEDANRFLLLTEEGEYLARKVGNNFILLTRFLEDVLGVPADISREDACKMEHLLSTQSSKALIHFLQVLFAQSDRLQPLLKEIRSKTKGCSEDRLCPVCEDAGECMMLPLEDGSVSRFATGVQPHSTAGSLRYKKPLKKG